MSNLIVKYSRAYLLHIYKAYGNTIINNTKQQQQLDLWCWTPYFVWPSEILMKYPFLVGDLSSFILSTCTCIYLFFFAKETWMTSIPSIWQVSELVAYNINLFSSTEYNWCEYCLPMKTVFFKISTNFYLVSDSLVIFQFYLFHFSIVFFL